MRRAVEQPLLELPIAGVVPCSVEEANAFLEKVGHRLGPIDRPFRTEAFKLTRYDSTVAVAISASTVSATAAGYSRRELVELARLGASEPWANRVMLRLWRELCGPMFGGWSVRAAVSYSLNAMHSGNLYRFDGWQRFTTAAGSSGGGTWSSTRDGGDPKAGRKSGWIWRYK